jgi:hypothetical protein
MVQDGWRQVCAGLTTREELAGAIYG